ncbi:hypothetical protein RB653_007329 [Dictyostelium firmibasis]|uniref:Ubiquitin-like-conjugating enzyme ATG10 n=1 Tax=Dictyostelium firmibasis TaxID=79012 RepID=A0AAN7TVG1_9MYCE
MLSAKDFRDQSIKLINKWNTIIDNEIPWQWNEIRELNNESKGYLTTKRYHYSNINNNTNDNDNCNNNNNNYFDEIEETIDSSTITNINNNNNNNNNNNSNSEKNIILFQFDIIYSKSYQVPVLYLNAFFSIDSSPLTWNEIWINLPLSNFDKNQQSTIPYITQVEHPILGSPCYQLHPCETDNLMKLVLLKEKENDNYDDDNEKDYFKDYYLLSWLSIIGPMVNIKIPFELLKIIE